MRESRGTLELHLIPGVRVTQDRAYMAKKARDASERATGRGRIRVMVNIMFNTFHNLQLTLAAVVVSDSDADKIV